MAGEKYATCLIKAMDSLWFHHSVLFSETPQFYFAKIPKTANSHPSKRPVISEQKTSPLPPTIITTPRDKPVGQEICQDEEFTIRDISTKPNPVPCKTKSNSSSPAQSQKQLQRKLSYSPRRLRKTMSCKSLVELELEEVKGFMDLGFKFGKETLNKRMMSLIPGLQRLNAHQIEGENNDERFETIRDFEDGAELGVMRPYLSEAWLVRRPDSPVMKLTTPRVCRNADMKKRLKYWARTVASTIQQVS